MFPMTRLFLKSRSASFAISVGVSKVCVCAMAGYLLQNGLAPRLSLHALYSACVMFSGSFSTVPPDPIGLIGFVALVTRFGLLPAEGVES